MNILLLDNTPLYREILQKTLGDKPGFKQTFANTVAQARQLIEEQHFDFFIFSWQLPDGNGLELAKQLRTSNQVPFEPIVLLTASASAELSDLANKAGVTEIFRKQDFEELISFMTRFLSVFNPIPCRVAYVEDSKDQRMALCAEMQTWGMTVDAFASADEAWPAIQATDYDIVICDVILDGRMTGSRLINRIRRLPGEKGSIPILAATAFDDPARRIELFYLGIDDYIHKPILIMELRARIQNLLARQRARQAAERLSQSKTAFLANMSHEIRTPLNAITGMAYLMRREGVPESHENRLQHIERAGKHLLDIINDVLDLAKIESGKLTLENAPLNLQSLAHDALSLFSEQAKTKSIELKVDISPLPNGLVGDSTRLRQCLLNYLSNALKFTDHGSITLAISPVSETADRCVVRFEVSDSGVGIAPDTISKLFNAFEQADTSTTRKYGGTGLGLAITRRLAQIMGGQTGLSSTLGQGSQFWFTVELSKRELSQTPSSNLSATEAEKHLRQHHAGKRILLVEDEATNQEITLALLDCCLFDIDVADNGQTAIESFAKEQYDLILMDMQMPVLDGLSATRQIRQLPHGRDIPIIAMTANAFAEDRHRCKEAGMSGFVAKPVDPQQFFGELMEALG